MSAFGTDPIVRPLIVEPPSIRKQRLDAAVAASKRAQARFEMARVVGETPGTLSDKRRALIEAIVRREVDARNIPSLATVRRLDRKWRLEACRSAADFRDDSNPRGPRPRAYPAEFVEAVGELAQRAGTGDLAELARRASQIAREFALDPVSPWHVRRILRCFGRHRVIAGRQGSRAAVMDGFVRSTYPTSRTHELWFLDEGDPQFWAAGFCRIRGLWYSIRPAVILIRDHRTGLFPGFFVTDPSRRINPETGFGCENGFDADDVFAALLSAASPDVAHPLLREYAGALPEKLQWDNASSHKLLEKTVFARIGNVRQVTSFVDPDIDEWVDPEVDAPELDTFRIPPRRPDRNGLIERMMGYVKSRLTDAKGDVRLHIPVDRLKDGEDLGRMRALAATDTTSRPTVLAPVAVHTLPTVERIADEVAAVLADYNANHILRRNGITPRMASTRFMPPRVRSGNDLIRTLPQGRYTVGAGIEIQRDGRSVVFYPVDNGVLLQRGDKVNAYVDPFLRRIWVEHGRRLVCMKPQDEAARERAAGDVARTIDQAARAASDAAVQARAEWLDAHAGAGAAQEGRRIYDEIRQRPKKAEESPAANAERPAPARSAAPAETDDDSDDVFNPNDLLPKLPPRRTDA